MTTLKQIADKIESILIGYNENIRYDVHDLSCVEKVVINEHITQFVFDIWSMNINENVRRFIVRVKDGVYSEFTNSIGDPDYVLKNLNESTWS